MNLRSAFGVVAVLVAAGLGPMAVAVDESKASDDPLIHAVAQSSTGFAAGLYSQLKTQPGNLVFAPFGLSQALVPLAAGTRGSTEEELTKVLHLTVPIVDAADGYSMLSRRLQLAAGGEVGLSFAKSLWIQQWNTVHSDYVELLREHCRSELRVIDFNRGDHAAQWMNKWVADRTGAMISAIAEAKSFDADTRLVVGNAVCFNVGWQVEFDPAQTKPRPFLAPMEQAPVDVPMMRQIASYRLAVQPGFRLLQVPYRGDQLVMVVLLPEPGGTLAQIETELTAERITECLRSVQRAEPVRVELSLPRFKAERPVSQLMIALQEMGAREIFDRNGAADFSGLGVNFDDEPIYLSGVNHLAKLTLDERGAAAPDASPVASAAGPPAAAPVTAPAAMKEGSVPEVQAPVAAIFEVDRPFLFFISDPTTGSLLFMGRVVDPRAS